MKRHITLHYVQAGEHVIFWVAEQTHRGKDFAGEGREVFRLQGFSLASFAYPELCGTDLLALRGTQMDKDAVPLHTNAAVFTKIQNAVRTYNENSWDEQPTVVRLLPPDPIQIAE